MSELKGAVIFGQSGGPTSVINSSAAGVFVEALKHDCITAVYGAAHGIKGILNEDFYDMSKEDPTELSYMGRTGTDRENAELICFLASDAASYISGQNIQIDGCRKRI